MLALLLNQSYLRGRQKLPLAAVRRAARVISRSLRIKSKQTISVVFVSEREIRRLNKHWRSIDKPTDVLSFKLKPGLHDFTIGEVILCLSDIKKHLRKNQNTREEVWRALIHGILHIYGFDHVKKKDAPIMLKLQEKIFKRI